MEHADDNQRFLLIAVWALCMCVICLELALHYRKQIAEADCFAARMYGENKFLRAIIISDDWPASDRPMPTTGDCAIGGQVTRRCRPEEAGPEPRAADKDC